jgi:hypothetical protein
MGWIEYQMDDGKIHREEYDDNVEKIDLSDSKIFQIKNLDRFDNLQKLDLSDNWITKIECLDRLTNLQKLDLSGNWITKIECLDRLTNLQKLDLSDNVIKRIENLDRLTNLQELDLSENQISRIECLDHLTNLQKLLLYGNPIDDVPMSIMMLRNLTTLNTDLMINPIISRFLTKNQIRSDRTIYQDGQNVHDTEINRSITDSLYRLMEQKTVLSEEMVMQEIIGDHILTEPVKQTIVEYTRVPDIHSQLNVTFLEALRYVWSVIRQHKETVEIKRVMDQEMKDSICRCFNGRLSKLVNCLNGFDDRVMVKISDQQELANLIIGIRQKTERFEEQQQQMVQKEMSDRGYGEQTIREWLGYLE